MSEIPATTAIGAPALPEQPAPGEGPGYDVRAVFREAGTGGHSPTGTGHRRVVRMIDPTPRDISAVPPLPVVGFADGVQARMVLRHEEHRPVTLMWVAAGAVGHGGKFLCFRQRLALVGSAADEAFLTRLSALWRPTTRRRSTPRVRWR